MEHIIDLRAVLLAREAITEVLPDLEALEAQADELWDAVQGGVTGEQEHETVFEQAIALENLTTALTAAAAYAEDLLELERLRIEGSTKPKTKIIPMTANELAWRGGGEYI